MTDRRGLSVLSIDREDWFLCEDVKSVAPRKGWAGGGHFQLSPDAISRRGLASIPNSGKPYVFCIHSREDDPGHPVPPGMRASNRFRQRVGLGRCESRFAMIAGDFEWATVAGLPEHWYEERARPWPVQTLSGPSPQERMH